MTPSSPESPRGGPVPSPLVASLVVGLALVLALGVFGYFDSLARGVVAEFTRLTTPRPTSPEAPVPTDASFVLRDLDGYPSPHLQPYIPGLTADSATTPAAPVAARPYQDASLERFHAFLEQFRLRQGVDDNFTIRLYDGRSGETLEVFELADLRTDYENGRRMDWGYIDRFRRSETNRLVRKYVRLGVPRDDVVVRWGRANQVRQAHARDLPFAEYEIRLARMLGLSLLPTEIGTVETFNHDHLVSPVGARSRYQIMPGNLQRGGVYHYRLPAATGRPVRVLEERHPLLALEPAFVLLKGFSGAMGHEVPGIAAYHSGPGNVYRLYRLFLMEPDRFHPASSTVLDAYAWGVTDGFERVRAASSFGPYSRAYVASVYGALRAVDSLAIDPSLTFEGVLVQLAPDASVSLDALLTALDTTAVALDWRTAPSGSTYERFRTLNPHMLLPEAPSTEASAGAAVSAGVPDAGNVQLAATVGDKAVRFFLPLQAPEALSAAGLDVLDARATMRFDGSTYAVTDADRTVWDRRYDALLDDVEQFGFTRPNRARLLAIYDAFTQLAAESPTPYRRMQLEAVRIHRRVWLSSPWTSLARATALATERVHMRVQQPTLLDVDLLDAPLRLPTDR